MSLATFSKLCQQNSKKNNWKNWQNLRAGAAFHLLLKNMILAIKRYE
jgi:hypothetical protein